MISNQELKRIALEEIKTKIKYNQQKFCEEKAVCNNPDCDNKVLIDDYRNGTIVCSSCGKVQDDNYVSMQDEKRHFDDNPPTNHRLGNKINIFNPTLEEFCSYYEREGVRSKEKIFLSEEEKKKYNVYKNFSCLLASLFNEINFPSIYYNGVSKDISFFLEKFFIRKAHIEEYEKTKDKLKKLLNEINYLKLELNLEKEESKRLHLNNEYKEKKRTIINLNNELKKFNVDIINSIADFRKLKHYVLNNNVSYINKLNNETKKENEQIIQKIKNQQFQIKEENTRIKKRKKKNYINKKRDLVEDIVKFTVHSDKTIKKTNGANHVSLFDRMGEYVEKISKSRALCLCLIKSSLLKRGYLVFEEELEQVCQIPVKMNLSITNLYSFMNFENNVSVQDEVSHLFNIIREMYINFGNDCNMDFLLKYSENIKFLSCLLYENKKIKTKIDIANEKKFKKKVLFFSIFYFYLKHNGKDKQNESNNFKILKTKFEKLASNYENNEINQGWALAKLELDELENEIREWKELIKKEREKGSKLLVEEMLPKLKEVIKERKKKSLKFEVLTFKKQSIIEFKWKKEVMLKITRSVMYNEFLLIENIIKEIYQ